MLLGAHDRRTRRRPGARGGRRAWLRERRDGDRLGGRAGRDAGRLWRQARRRSTTFRARRARCCSPRRHVPAGDRGCGECSGTRRRGRPRRCGAQRARRVISEVPAGDVDITKADFLLSIGRGIEGKDNIERFEELAARLGATLSVSRPIVDAGWMPASRQVGQSGKTVKPRIYLALGISGAVQHLAGMRTAETIIAVNTDPEAPIFGVAHYGAVADMFELADALERRSGSAPRPRPRVDRQPAGLLAFRRLAEGRLVSARRDLRGGLRLRRRAADGEVRHGHRAGLPRAGHGPARSGGGCGCSSRTRRSAAATASPGGRTAASSTASSCSSRAPSSSGSTRTSPTPCSAGTTSTGTSISPIRRSSTSSGRRCWSGLW